MYVGTILDGVVGESYRHLEYKSYGVPLEMCKDSYPCDAAEYQRPSPGYEWQFCQRWPSFYFYDIFVMGAVAFMRSLQSFRAEYKVQTRPREWRCFTSFISVVFARKKPKVIGEQRQFRNK